MQLGRRAGEIRLSGDIPSIVDPVGCPACSAQSPQVMHPSVAPEERMTRDVTLYGGKSDDLPVLIKASRLAVCSTKRTEIGHRAVLPKKWVHQWKARSRVD